jgi:hypothetical protein
MLNKLFGKEEPSLLKLNKGFTFEYQKIRWEIVDVFEYDWGRDGRSIEYKILGDTQEAYLEVENDDGEIIVIFSVDVDKDQLMPDFGPSDFEGEEILSELDYAGRRYQLEEINEGYYKNIAGMEPSQKLTNYGFYDGEHFVAIAQWDDGEMDFSVGQPISPKKIKNIKAPF